MIHKWAAGGTKVNDMGPFQAGLRGAEDLVAPHTPNFGYAFGNGIMKNFVFDGSFDGTNYNYDNLTEDSQAIATLLNATNPDLSEFREQGGKLILWNGMHDMAITPASTIQYYQDVIAHDASAAKDVALFMLPGVDHCSGGVGPWLVDWMSEGNQWADSGEAPKEMTAHWLMNNSIWMGIVKYVHTQKWHIGTVRVTNVAPRALCVNRTL
ncbi:tannase/feruloyl esterase family alpha/beta hydrolase [Vibrio mexicanus]|uniref:tannase/feruloyl esterase family alpha/beta hydrolase n=1 Tax=Vibrio mexicanus TaxID=1004326 RepID=UPI00063C3A20|nr:tannase/feruloyl esterase family alpha/beta hydrolase [Vibrio mexicanus]